MRTGGLVDPTLVDEIERVGYATDLAEVAPSGESPAGTVRRAAGPHPDGRWRELRADRRAGTVTRRPGTRFDSGGIAKGVFADELAATLAAHHLLDPSTGRPAFTGLVQVTALAPGAAEAEALSKAALLSGPGAAEQFLPCGGVAVSDDGTVQVFDAAWPSSHVQRSSRTRPCSGSLKISW